MSQDPEQLKADYALRHARHMRSPGEGWRMLSLVLGLLIVLIVLGMLFWTAASRIMQLWRYELTG